MNTVAMETPARGPRERLQDLYPRESKSLLIMFLELFFSRWMIICGIFFAASFWSWYALERARDTYEASGQVLIRRGAIQSIQNLPILRQQEEVGSEIDIMLSIAVLNETVRQLLREAGADAQTDVGGRELIFDTYPPTRPRTPITLADLPTTDPAKLFKYLKDRFRIGKFGESNVLEVVLVSPSPNFAAEAVNTLIDVYEKFNLTVDNTPGQSDYFAKEIAKVDQEINTLQAELVEYKSRNGVVDAEKERELMALRRHALQTQLDELEVDKAGLETDLELVRNPERRLQASFLRNDMAIRKLRESLFFQRNKLAELRSQLTEDNPLVKAKREEVEALEADLRLEEDLAIAQQQHLYRQVLNKERLLKSTIAELERKLLQYPRLEAEIERYDRDIKQRTLTRIDMVEQLVKSATLERPDESLNKVKILGYAQVPAFPREARKGFKLLVAVTFSLIAAFVVGVFVEGLDHTIRRREEIEERLQVPYLTSLSTHPNVSGAR